MEENKERSLTKGIKGSILLTLETNIIPSIKIIFLKLETRYLSFGERGQGNLFNVRDVENTTHTRIFFLKMKNQ
jgi:hypothetical protein